MNEVVGKAGIGNRIGDLNAGWRNALISSLGLPKDSFQLIQGTMGLPFDQPVTLFALADKTPSRSCVHYCDAQMRWRWSDGYIRLLTALLPETENGLRGYLGSSYSHWIAWRNAGVYRDSQLTLFRNWSNSHLSPARAKRALSLFEDSMLTANSIAIERFFDGRHVIVSVTPRGIIGRFPKYSGTVRAAKDCLRWYRPTRINFDSWQMDTSTPRGGLFQGSDSRQQTIFSGATSAAFDSLEHRAAKARFTINGDIGAHGWLRTSPGAWCDEQLLQHAIEDERGTTIWDCASNAGGWGTFFSSRGCLVRRRTHLLVVSDYRLELTCHETFNEAEVAHLRGRSRGGIWPFFSSESRLSGAEPLRHNLDGSLSLTISHPAEGFQIWGAEVQSLFN